MLRHIATKLQKEGGRRVWCWWGAGRGGIKEEKKDWDGRTEKDQREKKENKTPKAVGKNTLRIEGKKTELLKISHLETTVARWLEHISSAERKKTTKNCQPRILHELKMSLRNEDKIHSEKKKKLREFDTSTPAIKGKFPNESKLGTFGTKEEQEELLISG